MLPQNPDYQALLAALKDRISSAQLRASIAVNRELVSLYWHIGRDILDRQEQLGWGAKVVDRISQDLARSFPGMKGFSPRNLKYMRAFAEAWPDQEFVQQSVAQIPWGHNVRLLDLVQDRQVRIWYIRKIIEQGWSRNILVHQIESGLHLRQGQALTNFEQNLPRPQSDLAREMLKNPYSFDFLTISEDAREREIEQALVAHIKDFLLELGKGFAFVGSQYHLEVGGQDFYLDLLFYHLHLRCYVIIELKAGEFQPEFTGKLNFYLAAVDDTLRHPDDRPSIGLLLCKSHNQLIVEYALKDMAKPIGVSSYELTRALPEEMRTSLPTIEELEAELK